MKRIESRVVNPPSVATGWRTEDVPQWDCIVFRVSSLLETPFIDLVTLEYDSQHNYEQHQFRVPHA